MFTGKNIIFTLAVLSLAGCASEKGSAPPPPGFYPVFSEQSKPVYSYEVAQKSTDTEVLNLQFIEPAAGIQVQEDYRLISKNEKDNKGYKPYTDANTALKQIIKRDGCHIKDRFDRKAVLAYQWGRNRIGFDVDGINFKSTDIDKVKMTYRLNLQNHASKKDKCRYSSSWQGMIGSSYNEFYKRDNDTVMDRFSALRKELKKRIDW